MARVYLETSFVSACVTDRDDASSLCRRKASREWWDTQRVYHNLFISAEVIREKVRHLRVICRRLGLVPPEIVVPDLLWET